jgi:excisionase family DNA binding protein
MSEVERELKAIRLEIEKVLKRMDARLVQKPVALSMEDAARTVSLGDTKFRELCKAKQIPTFMVPGTRRRLVRMADLEEWAERQMTPVEVRFPKRRGKARRSVEEQVLAELKSER